MPTPTTPHVLAKDRTPPMFRPVNQANLEPATPQNFSATQNMLPGMGRVQSGNDPSNNGLGPDDAEFTRIAKGEERRRAKAKHRAESAAGRIQHEIAETKAVLDRAAARGQEMPRQAARKLNQLQARLAWIGNMERAEAKQARTTSAMPFHRRTRVFSPPSPDPLQYEPIGISHQRNQAKIRDMQDSIQPVTPYGATTSRGPWQTAYRRPFQSSLRGLGNLATQPLVVGGLIIGGLYLMNKSKGR